MGAISRTLCFTEKKKKEKTSRKKKNKHKQNQRQIKQKKEIEKKRECARDRAFERESDGVLGSNKSSVVRQHSMCVRGQRSGQFEIVGS
jgi:hypothetical protein